MSRPVLAALILPVLLAGCGWVSIGSKRQQAAPAADGGALAPPPSVVSAPVAQTITVQPGDTIYTVARNRNVPVRALIAANNLQPPYSLSPGRTLILPPAQTTHTVKPGDTLYALSRQYGADVTSIAKANGMQPPFALQVGQQVLIPGAPASVAEARPAPAPGLMPASRSIDPRPDAVAVETVPLSAPPRPVAPPPPVSSSIVPPPAPVAPPPPAMAAAAPLRPTAAPPPAPSVPPPPPVVASAPAAAPESASAEPPPRSGRGFLRPVSGQVVTPFGPRPGGLHNDGINISVPRGTPVRATEAGTVAYAGNELPGYGNLVLIKHADGWVSAYGHNDELLVRRGQAVKRGDVIAKAGATGNVNQPQVHFELRRGARAVDPAPYLAGGSASR